jgi:hypothetical protein
MEEDWNMFVDLENTNFISDQENQYPKDWNKVIVKKKIRNVHFLYTIDEVKEEETDYFKKSPIKEKNKYSETFSSYKLKSKSKSK